MCLPRCFTTLIFVPLVICVAGEQQLRGQPPRVQSLLSTEGKSSAKLVSEKHGEHKSLLGISKGLRRVFFGTGKSDPDDDEGMLMENIHALTDAKAFALVDTAELIITFGIWVIVYVLVAAYYHNSVLYYAPVEASKEELEQREHYRDFQEWKSGLFSCHEHPGITFWSCCCPGIRWADTVSKLGIHRYWTAFWGMTLCYFLTMLPIATGICFLCVVFYCTYFRQEIRKHFKFDEVGGATWCTDCLTYCCCFCCAVAQEARQTREACIVGHPAINPDTPRTY